MADADEEGLKVECLGCGIDHFLIPNLLWYFSIYLILINAASVDSGAWTVSPFLEQMP